MNPLDVCGSSSPASESLDNSDNLLSTAFLAVK